VVAQLFDNVDELGTDWRYAVTIAIDAAQLDAVPL
jgi:hypothetical protein